jgi:hypothetical protein
MRLRYIFKLIAFGKYEMITEEIKEPREDGFYWVKHQGKWTIAEYFQDQWVFLGDIGLMKDEHFDKIHEDRIEEPGYL